MGTPKWAESCSSLQWRTSSVKSCLVVGVVFVCVCVHHLVWCAGGQKLVSIQKLVPNNLDKHVTKVGWEHYSCGCEFHIGIKMALQGGTVNLILKWEIMQQNCCKVDYLGSIFWLLCIGTPDPHYHDQKHTSNLLLTVVWCASSWTKESHHCALYWRTLVSAAVPPVQLDSHLVTQRPLIRDPRQKLCDQF